MASKREVTAAVAMRYQRSTRNEKESILDDSCLFCGTRTHPALWTTSLTSAISKSDPSAALIC
jgi:hypothetical protein